MAAKSRSRFNTKPTVKSVSPSNGSTAGGTSVTISGASFVAGATVKIGSASASSVTVVSASSITCLSPAQAAGTYSVTVTTSNGTSTLVAGFSYTSPAVVLCVRAGATGTGTGADWTDALTDLDPAALQRNTTYLVAAGRYSAGSTAPYFNTPESGSQVITVQRATVSNHGPNTGWNNAYDGQVHFAYPLIVESGYWSFDGVTGSMVNDPTQYGFTVDRPASCSTADQNYLFIGNTSGSPVSNVTIQHLSINSCGAAFDVAQIGLFLSAETCGLVSNVYVSSCYFGNLQVPVSWNGTADCTLDHCWFDPNWSSGAHHGEHVQFNATNSAGNNLRPTIRFCKFVESAGTGTIVALNDFTGVIPATIKSGSFYGNVVVSPAGGNGVFGGSSTAVFQDCAMYNNTIVAGTAVPYYATNPGSPVAASASGNVFLNNLVWNNPADIVLNGAPDPTHDYNTYFSCTGTIPTEAHGQTGSTDPFVNSAADNFHLGTDTAAWSPLASPYNVDIDGVIRTSSRGAYQKV